MEIHLLNEGSFTIEKSNLVYGKYHGQIYNAASKPLLVITEKEKILIDTGIGDLPAPYSKYTKIERRENENLKAQLLERGLKPEDITMVINTHLHFDHVGNNRLFPKAKFLVQVDEIRYAYFPDRFQKSGYVRELFDVGVEYEPVKGEYRVDDGITIIPTPGHSIGHQSVVIRREKQNIVYCGDCASLKESIERRNISGVLYNPVQALESIDLLKRIKDPLFIYSHDNEQRSI